MAKLTITIESGNAAVVDDPHGEISRAVKIIAGKISSGQEDDDMHIWDSNGNVIGSWSYDAQKEEEAEVEEEEE